MGGWFSFSIFRIYLFIFIKKHDSEHVATISESAGPLFHHTHLSSRYIDGSIP